MAVEIMHRVGFEVILMLTLSLSLLCFRARSFVYWGFVTEGGGGGRGEDVWSETQPLLLRFV